MLTILTNDVGEAVGKEKGKRGDVVGARFNDLERERWDAVMEIVAQRNPLAKSSDVLRDFLFGNLGLVTQAERDILAGKRENVSPIYAALKTRTASEIARETGINIITVTKVMADQLEGIAPEDIEIIQTALKEKPGDDNITPLRIRNGR